MFLIRGIHDDVLPINRQAIEEVKKIFTSQFPDAEPAKQAGSVCREVVGMVADRDWQVTQAEAHGKADASWLCRAQHHLHAGRACAGELLHAHEL